MSERTVVGVQPWLPWPLTHSPWWNTPVRAERLAALRIGLAAVLLLDILCIYLPNVSWFFGAGSLGAPEVFANVRGLRVGSWSLLAGVESPGVLWAVTLLWGLSALLLLVGLAARWSAAVAWALSISFLNLNPFLHNAGDTVRIIVLFYLMLSPCGAVWSVDAWLQRRVGAGPVYVAPWPLRLLFVQLVAIYFFNGVFKLAGKGWHEGNVLHYVLADPAQTRWSYAELPLPWWGAQALTWTVLAWEILFPLLVLMPMTRTLALVMGVLFHLGIGVSIELGFFPFYMLSLYLPLLPWERLGPPEETKTSPTAVR
jgi:hypothetical protein